ncbi:UxaA family hydrolase [Nocardioides sp. NPDC058538]|uniref:UxaA family hydrolase n=1 Tax=Nocardioides sp. NPDC058538 TaxID=3346542 RepID=UPI003647DB16
MTTATTTGEPWLTDLVLLPEPGDNVGVALRTLASGTPVRLPDGRVQRLPHTVLEGHRLVVEPVRSGAPLLSWGTPFAIAEQDLLTGDYVCTASTLAALRQRDVQGLPTEPTARNVAMDPFVLDPAELRFGAQAVSDDRRTFQGYRRASGGWGTRNHVVVVAVTSRGSSFVTELARRFEGERSDTFDGVVPVAHTEAGEDVTPNNVSMVLSVLAGFLVHPNVGAVLLVDEPGSVIDAERVRAQAHELGLGDPVVPWQRLTREGAFAADLDRATDVLRGWIPQISEVRREPAPLSELSVALQCGGSDAFSGISANPLAGALGREVVARGGTAVLAETDELIGAEGFVLENVRDEETARRFLRKVESFKERVGWHGQTAEGNPSGGNVYRGLYNIVLKSIGAARKRDRAMRLDHVVDYGEPIPGTGFVFMDSPGNDLESVAGQVASGCNLVLFTTGNGSITNFPFVPTLKLVTTSARYELLSSEMDIDAGRYLTGTPMEELTSEYLDLLVEVASGRPSAGERAGHSQVSIWREWRQTGPREGVAVPPDGRLSRELEDFPADDRDALLEGLPLPAVAPSAAAPDLSYAAHGTETGGVPEQVALLLPTSLCSGQIAVRLARQAEDEGWFGNTVDRVVALPHTEGCGVTSGAAEETFVRTMLGHLTHSHVRLGLLLEHGCEKTHNDYFRHRLLSAGADPDSFGWASIQRDGGLEAVGERVRTWARSAAAHLDPPDAVCADLGGLSLGLEAFGDLTPVARELLATVGGWVVAAGGSVLLGDRGSLVRDPEFRRLVFGSDAQVAPTLAHGQRAAVPGWHVMRMPGSDWLEVATGLASGGAQLLLAHAVGGSLTAPRLVPLVQVTTDPATGETFGPDLDNVLTGPASAAAYDVVVLLRQVASRERVPAAAARGDVGFQVTRGLLGTSM